eukprot:TRINITY_DN112_c0_g1_i1.p1 TRINITY_DN112_c0_g1~~TRINITY_DN112_c0_g1_i1.p1  ORF type:complete len:190 (-),score=39.51 TRINITY_DN112_c0_g1_i1:306-875(-)
MCIRDRYQRRVRGAFLAMTLRVPLLFVLLASALACVPPDCTRVDRGTCVNACCKLQWIVQDDPETFANKIAAHLSAQGGDSRYTLHQNDPTIQPWNSNTSFVVQGQHISAKNLYVDTLHFAVSPAQTGSGSTVLAFSHSQDFVLGNFAYGDDGQNYKNLAFFIKGMGATYDETTLMGCPLPSEVLPVDE